MVSASPSESLGNLRFIGIAYALPDRQQVDTYPTTPYIYYVYIP